MILKMSGRQDVKREVINKGKYIDFLKVGNWEYFQRCNCAGIVIILALTDDGKVLFVEQYRPPVGAKVIEFPAGLVDDGIGGEGESVCAAAKRELLEETGYAATIIEEVLKGPVSAGSSSDMVTLVYAKKLKKVDRGGGINDESIVIHEVDLDKCEEWLNLKRDQGFLIEPKIYSGLYFLLKLSQEK